MDRNWGVSDGCKITKSCGTKREVIIYSFSEAFEWCFCKITDYSSGFDPETNSKTFLSVGNLSCVVINFGFPPTFAFRNTEETLKKQNPDQRSDPHPQFVKQQNTRNWMIYTKKPLEIITFFRNYIVIQINIDQIILQVHIWCHHPHLTSLSSIWSGLVSVSAMTEFNSGK